MRRTRRQEPGLMNKQTKTEKKKKKERKRKRKRKNLSSSEFFRSGGSENETQRKRKDKQILGPFLRTKKKMWHLRVMRISIGVGAHGTVPKSLEMVEEELGIWGMIETIQITELWRSSRLLRSKETCCRYGSSERLLADSGMKNSLGVNINYNDTIF